MCTLAFARVGGLHGATIRLYVATDGAAGVIKGTEVWSAGQVIGQVNGTMLRPVTVDTSARVLVSADILRHYAHRVRRDTRVQIGPGSSLVGAPVVFLSGGTAGAPAINDGDTLVSQPQRAFDETRSAYTSLGQQVPALYGDVRALLTQLSSPKGAIGAARTQEGPATTAVIRSLAGRLTKRALRRSPAVGAMSDTLEARARRLLATADTLRRVLAAKEGTLDRFDRDSAIVQSIRDTRAQIDTTRRLLTTPAGTLGRLHTDDALRRRLADADSSLSVLMHDAMSQPVRYLPF